MLYVTLSCFDLWISHSSWKRGLCCFWGYTGFTSQPYKTKHTYKCISPHATTTDNCSHTRLGADVRQRQTVESYSSTASCAHYYPAWRAARQRQQGVCDELNESVWVSECSYINWQWRLSILSTSISLSTSPSHMLDRQKERRGQDVSRNKAEILHKYIKEMGKAIIKKRSHSVPI